MLLEATSLAASAELPGEDRILAVGQKMISAFEKAEDFTCEAEVLYHRGGAEDNRWQIRFFFKKGDRFRVDFSSPHKGVSVFYEGGEEELTVRPFRFFPALKFRLSIDNPIVKTPSGQRIDQTGVGFFIRFIFRNLKLIQQRENEFQEDDRQIGFLLWALDYIEGKDLEKYRVFVSKRIWFPTRIKRYSLEGTLIEEITFKNYVINPRLEDNLFLP